ncbi:MAG: response regulator transcription factor [Anaerolineales bacterium]|nr:response regulator transcription factor [Anaerolineales bacterium]
MAEIGAEHFYGKLKRNYLIPELLNRGTEAGRVIGVMNMKYHILVIDDNAKTLEVLKLALERAGFRVTTADSWKTVEDKVKIGYRVKDPYDLVVLDLMIPERSGFEILRSLKVILVPMPPVIVLSAITDVKKKVEARDLGVAKYLTKPTTPDRLIKAIRDVLL